MEKIKNYLKNWNFMRLLRLALGVFIVVQGILQSDWAFILLGTAFSLTPLFNIGCCGTQACQVPIEKRKAKSGEVSFEEIK